MLRRAGRISVFAIVLVMPAGGCNPTPLGVIPGPNSTPMVVTTTAGLFGPDAAEAPDCRPLAVATVSDETPDGRAIATNADGTATVRLESECIDFLFPSELVWFVNETAVAIGSMPQVDFPLGVFEIKLVRQSFFSMPETLDTEALTVVGTTEPTARFSFSVVEGTPVAEECERRFSCLIIPDSPSGDVRVRFDATESSGGFASSITLRRWFDNGVQFGTDPVITIVISPGEHTIRLEVENDAGNQHARELTGLIAG